MKIISISDIHLSDKANDAHRYGVFDQTIDFIDLHKPDVCIIPGDITHEIDHHSAVTVNKVTEGIASLARWIPLEITMGNHDLKDTKLPYFLYLNFIPNVYYHQFPTLKHIHGEKILFLPHTRDPLRDWNERGLMEYINDPEVIIFAHVAVNNVMSEGGHKLESSVDASIFDNCKMAFSGDIHHAQRIGSLEYIGSPYPTSFSDNNFQGRGVLIDTETKTIETLKYNFPRRLTFEIKCIEDFDQLASHYSLADDQVKIKLIVTEETMGRERIIQQQLKERFASIEAQWCGFVPILDSKLTPQKKESRETKNITVSTFADYCDRNKLIGAVRAVGQDIMNEALRHAAKES